MPSLQSPELLSLKRVRGETKGTGESISGSVTWYRSYMDTLWYSRSKFLKIITRVANLALEVQLTQPKYFRTWEGTYYQSSSLSGFVARKVSWMISVVCHYAMLDCTNSLLLWRKTHRETQQEICCHRNRCSC